MPPILMGLTIKVPARESLLACPVPGTTFRKEIRWDSKFCNWEHWMRWEIYVRTLRDDLPNWLGSRAFPINMPEFERGQHTAPNIRKYKVIRLCIDLQFIQCESLPKVSAFWTSQTWEWQNWDSESFHDSCSNVSKCSQDVHNCKRDLFNTKMWQLLSK